MQRGQKLPAALNYPCNSLCGKHIHRKDPCEPQKRCCIYNWAVFSAASFSRLWDYPIQPGQSEPTVCSEAWRTQDKEGLCMRKLTEALGSWCWGGTKDFPPPETNWNQYSYHVNLRWSRFALQTPATRLPISYCWSQLQRKYSGHLKEDPLFERHERKCQPLRKEEMIIWISGY